MLTTFHLSELEPSISLAHTHAKPAFQTLFLQGPSQDGRTITMLGTVLMMSLPEFYAGTLWGVRSPVHLSAQIWLARAASNDSAWPDFSRWAQRLSCKHVRKYAQLCGVSWIAVRLAIAISPDIRCTCTVAGTSQYPDWGYCGGCQDGRTGQRRQLAVD